MSPFDAHVFTPRPSSVAADGVASIAWPDDLLSGRVRSVDELARRKGVEGRSVRRMIRLGFLSPRIVAAIAEGRQPVELTVIELSRRFDLSLLWKAQERALGIR